MSDVEYSQSDLDSLESQHQPAGASLVQFIRALPGYFEPLAAVTIACGVGYLLLAIAFFLSRPVQRNTTLGFRLEFAGADRGEYPNGLRFSGSDIIVSPVLKSVFDANDLGRFIAFNEFSRSVVVLESNAALDQLSREYEAKLANPKLTTVERERLEAQFDEKRSSLRKNEYSLVLSTRERLTHLPRVVASKVMQDILRTWADFAANRQQVLLYRVPLVSEQGIAAQMNGTENDILTSLLALRTAARALHGDIDNLRKLPGAEVIRSSTRRLSLSELDLLLSQLERTRLEYAISGAIRTRALNPARTVGVLESHLAYDTAALAAAENHVRILRDSLDDYEQRNPEAPAPSAAEPAKPASGENVTSQVNETFLSQIVELARTASDLEYRKEYVKDIREAALITVPLKATVDYERALLAELRESPSGEPVALDSLQTEKERIVKDLQSVARDLSDIRRILSGSLTASGQLYTITQPPAAVVERSVSLLRLALIGLAVVIMTAAGGIAAAYVHYRLRTDPSNSVAEPA